MKLSTQTEAEILQLYHTYWDAYLSGDFETFASFLDDNIVIYGTAVGEIFTSKEEALKFYIDTGEEMTGKAEFRNRNITIQPVGDTIVIYEQSQLHILIEDTWTFYGFARISGIFERKSNGWKLVHQHGSFPDSRTEEGQQIASEKIKEENLQLREAVYRRTVELENKTRELEIESSLERVRTIAMSMRNPDDMLGVCRVIADQLQTLGIKDIRNVQTAIIRENDKTRYTNYQYFVSYQDGVIEHVDSTRHPKVREMILQMQASPDAYYSHSFEGAALKEWIQYRNSDGQFPDPILENAQSVHFYFYSIGQGGLGFSTYTPITQENLSNFLRFRNVFALAYQRFRDIEQAEAQAKEAQIELALERIRARTMAMQKSAELKEVIQLVFEQFLQLNIKIEHTGFVIDYKSRDDYNIWVADPLGVPSRITIPYFDSIYYNRFNEAKKLGEDFFATNLTFEEKNTFYHKLFEYIPGLPEEAKKFYFSCPGLAASTVLLDDIGLYIENFSGIPYTDEENKTLMRFGKVFQQTYTRFLDLQKAEAQAREALIEVALEKVRSRTMAMQSSNELQETAAVLFQEFKKLGAEDVYQVTIGIYNVPEQLIDFRVTNWAGNGEQESRSLNLDMNEPTLLQPLVEAWKANKKSVEIDLTGEALEGWLTYRNKMSGVNIRSEDSGGRRVVSAAFFTKGHISISTPAPILQETLKTLERFAAVFDGTYTRFLDLQKSESQTKKVKIEVALERVRARALAMQEPEELVEVAQVMRHEMGLLGIEELETSSIYIHDEGSDIADCWYAIKDIRAPEKKLVADHITKELHKTWVGREMLEFYNSSHQQSSIVMQGANRLEWIKYCSDISNVLEGFYGDVIPDRTYHLYKFSNGAIGAAAEGDISTESWELLQRATSVFSLAYSRFKDLTQARLDLQKLKTEKQRAEDALAHLKAVQTQLIQSEKMASLGELTAGIAHEIQNPLNFVNNFSEVNTELIEEMKQELQTGNTDEAIAIANDIADNEQKINHHGKRADAIVKGMLQHSRSSSGVKEPTDINALADEYLRLAYHGLRAKDKTFNATMKTDFDPSIGLINVIPQDIGRVILNLITNAFYAVSTITPKSPDSSAPWPPEGGKNYAPTVSVSTRLLKSPVAELSYKDAGKQVEASGDLGAKRSTGDLGVEITVSDNGPGIPQHILDKIFQPFFTTKPTGQGTGLGLSLSYDIVKAHGGELKVQTTEGEGTEFTIILPI